MVQWRPFLMIWGVLLGLFLWTVLPVLSPLILFLVLAYMLWPLFGTDTYKRLMLPLGALTFLWLLHVAGNVLAPFALAFVLAYVADPLVDWWASRGIGRLGAWGPPPGAHAGRSRGSPHRSPGPRRGLSSSPTSRASCRSSRVVQRAGHGVGQLPAADSQRHSVRARAGRGEQGRRPVHPRRDQPAESVLGGRHGGGQACRPA